MILQVLTGTLRLADSLLHVVVPIPHMQRIETLFLSLMVQAMQQSNYYMGLQQRHPGMALMPALPLPGMQAAPMHAPMVGYQYRPAYGHGAPVQSVVSADGSTLRLRGLPYSAGAEEIANFFLGMCILSRQKHCDVLLFLSDIFAKPVSHKPASRLRTVPAPVAWLTVL